MCDTLFVPGSFGSNGSAFFAKNSDRRPGEPQVMTLTTGGKWPCLLSRPVWMRGAEMGINANGVVLGNEAVFSRWKPARDGVLGMEILRRALEEAGSAREAVDFIGDFVQTRSQGGNGAYKGKLFYDNSFLVADFREAWIIETAGHRWAARKVTGPASISNSYSLAGDFDLADPATREEKTPGYSWKKRVENPLFAMITQGDFRRGCTSAGIAAGGVGLEGIFSILRSHGPRGPRGMKSVCMHGGGLGNSATTASMVVELRAAEHRAVIWFTAQALPCASLFRPAVLQDGALCPLWEDYDYTEGAPAAEEYWQGRRAAAGTARAGAPGADRAAQRDAAQRRLIELTQGPSRAFADPAIRREVSAVVKEFEDQ